MLVTWIVRLSEGGLVFRAAEDTRKVSLPTKACSCTVGSEQIYLLKLHCLD